MKIRIVESWRQSENAIRIRGTRVKAASEPETGVCQHDVLVLASGQR